MSERTVFDWGQRSHLAPSIKRADPLAWAAESAFHGTLLGLLALWALWRPLLWIDGPPGGLSEHLGMLAKLGVHKLLPMAFAPDARFYVEWLASLPGAARFALIWRVAVAAMLFVLPWPLLASSRLRGRDGLVHLRGSTRLSGKEAARALAGKLRKRAKRRPDHEVAPGVPFPADLWTRHMLMVGGTGAGKSTVVKPLIQKIVKAREQMLLFDPKGDFTMAFAEPSILAPWDARSLAWDIAKDMRNLLDMRRFAATTIKESHDPMWSNASRQLLVGLLIYLKKTRGNDWGWAELRDLVSLPHLSLRKIMERWHPEAVRAVDKASVTTAGILINLSSFCSSIFDLAEAWGQTPKSRRVSFVEWIHGRSRFRQIILQGHGAYVELTKSYVEGIVGLISALVNSVEMEDSFDRKIWFLADEFAKMGKVPVRELFEVGRSRGVRCVVACQDFAQLEEIHGAQMVKALIGMCGTLVVGQITQGETAEQLCKAFGTREVERANVSASSSGAPGSQGSSTLSFSREEVPLYKPSELTSRLGPTPAGDGVVLALFTGGDAYELTWPLFPMVKRRARNVLADWAKEVQIEAIPDPEPPSDVNGATQEASVAGGGRGADASSQEGGPSPAQSLPSKAVGSEGAEQEDDLVRGLCEVFDAASVVKPARELPPPMAVDTAMRGDAREELSPLFDAAAELAALKLGLGAVGVALHAASALDAAAPSGRGAAHRGPVDTSERRLDPEARRLR